MILRQRRHPFRREDADRAFHAGKRRRSGLRAASRQETSESGVFNQSVAALRKPASAETDAARGASYHSHSIVPGGLLVTS